MSLEDDLRTVWTALAKDDRPDAPVLVAFSRIANALDPRPTQETSRMSDAEFMREASGLAAKDAENARLESQIQALQDEAQILRENDEMLLRESAALQERAEKAEAALREIAEMPDYDANVAGSPSACGMSNIALAALSPTQETDPG